MTSSEGTASLTSNLQLQWSPFIIVVILFTTLLPASTLSLFGLTFITDFLFNIQEIVPAASSRSIQLLQLAYAQEQNEETDETEGEDDNKNGKEGDEDDRQTNSIDICCSWDERLADGILTYRITEEVEDDNDDEEDEENHDDEEDDTNGNTYDSTSVLRKAVQML